MCLETFVFNGGPPSMVPIFARTKLFSSFIFLFAFVVVDPVLVRRPGKGVTSRQSYRRRSPHLSLEKVTLPVKVKTLVFLTFLKRLRVPKNKIHEAKCVRSAV